MDELEVTAVDEQNALAYANLWKAHRTGRAITTVLPVLANLSRCYLAKCAENEALKRRNEQHCEAYNEVVTATARLQEALERLVLDVDELIRTDGVSAGERRAYKALRHIASAALELKKG